MQFELSNNLMPLGHSQGLVSFSNPILLAYRDFEFMMDIVSTALVNMEKAPRGLNME
jgi:hypothetical protein